jgi:hypothetical protein
MPKEVKARLEMANELRADGKVMLKWRVDDEE